MKNKKLLILLGIALFSLIIFLIVYAVSINQSTIPITSKVPLITNSKPQTVTLSDEERLAEIAELKKAANSINNDSFEIVDSENSSQDYDKEEVKEYQKKITTGQATVGEGTIASIKTSSLTVKFIQGPLSWVSNIKVDSKTSVSTINAKSEKIPISLESLKVGEKVVVQTATNIADADFTAIGIFKFIQN
jgi:hypothetical protein